MFRVLQLRCTRILEHAKLLDFELRIRVAQALSAANSGGNGDIWGCLGMPCEAYAWAPADSIDNCDHILPQCTSADSSSSSSGPANGECWSKRHTPLLCTQLQ